MPELPEELQSALADSLRNDRLRRMPNSFLPPVEQGGEQSKEGVILVGDSWNMRHPLTGGEPRLGLRINKRVVAHTKVLLFQVA